MKIQSPSSFYLTTAIDYPNADPHIGHAYEKIVTDAYARWYQLLGSQVFLLTGTDENGQKLTKSAEVAKVNTKDFVEGNVAKFRKLCENVNMSFSDFIRTTEDRHKQVVQQIWKKLMTKGDIYVGKYSGHYCIACETFYTETQTVAGKCPTHEVPLSYVEETGYFFKLSKYHNAILNHINTHSKFLVPGNFRAEILSRLNLEPLTDLSISRPNQGWGIEVPGDANYVIYTWFDALISYYTSTQLGPEAQPRNLVDSLWPANIHVIGKDISWFHAVIWSALLMSADIELPKQIYVHGMVLGNDGRRMSKSLGNGVDPQHCLEKYPIDTLRYFLLKAIPSGQDGAFGIDEMIRLHNAELANEFGNLINRVIKLGVNNLGTHIAPASKIDVELNLFEDINAAMEQREHHKALAMIWTGVRRLNAYIHNEEPWKKKEDSERFHQIIYTALINVNFLTTLLTPFIPQSAKRALLMLGGEGSVQDFIDLKLVAFHIQDGEPLFPRILN